MFVICRVLHVMCVIYFCFTSILRYVLLCKLFYCMFFNTVTLYLYPYCKRKCGPYVADDDDDITLVGYLTVSHFVYLFMVRRRCG